MARTPDRKVCRGQQRGHGDRCEGWSRVGPGSASRTGQILLPTLRGLRGLVQTVHLGPPSQGTPASNTSAGEELHVNSRHAELITFWEGENRQAAGGCWPQICLSFPLASEKATVPLTITLCLCTGLTFSPNVRAARFPFSSCHRRQHSGACHWRLMKV